MSPRGTADSAEAKRPSPTRVERIDGWDPGPPAVWGYAARATVTWAVWLDGELLGNAYTEDEGHRWIADMQAQREKDSYLSPEEGQ